MQKFNFPSGTYVTATGTLFDSRGVPVSSPTGVLGPLSGEHSAAPGVQVTVVGAPQVVSDVQVNESTKKFTTVAAQAAVRAAAGAVRSSYYRAFLPGIQPLGSGNVIDYSNNAADGRITPTTALTDAECWAVRDGFSTVAASTNPPKVVSIPASKAQINGTTESIFFSMGIKLATPAATTTVAGFNSGASKGWRLPIDSSGGVLLRLGDGTNQYSPGASPSLKVTAATPEWHTVGFLFDCVTKQVWEVVDGMIASGPNASGLTGDLTNSLDLWIGGNSGVNNASFAASFRGVHLIAIPGGLPSNVVDLIRKVHTDPYTALTTADLGG